nr:retrovirus-related Pol polyprotein from transposon TNT 1-94 [Tanacetum cinerariifolium]
MDESIPWDQKCNSSKELFKIKKCVDMIFDGVERCKQTIMKRTYFGHIDPFIQNTIEGNFCLQIRRINADLEKFHLCLKEEMVTDLRYFNFLEHEVDSLKSKLDTQKTQFLNEIDRLSREYYYADHMNAILGVYTDLDEVTNLQWVTPITSVSRPQLKSNQLEDRVIPNNSQGKMQQVKDHHRNFKFPNNKTSVTVCNDSFNAKTSNVNFVCVTCGKCVLNDNHNMCVLHYMKGVNSRTKQPISVPVSNREPKRTVNQSVTTSLMTTVASDSTNQKPRKTTRKLYEHVSTMKFGNDQIASILGYGDLVQGKVTIKRVYYIKGLNHNLFSIAHLCDADLEVDFRKSTCYICDLKGNDLLTGSHDTDLYSITLQDTSTTNPICLMAKVTSSQAWLWHRRLFHLNFDTINLLSKNDIVIGLPKLKFVKDHLCSSCELGKAKQKSFHTKTTPSSKKRLQLLHMDLCGPMRVESINGKKYVLVILDDYSRYACTHFLRSKDETPAVLIDFITLVQRGLHAQVKIVQTDKGMKFLNKTLHAYFAKKAARTMLSAAKVSLFFWAEAIATACFTQNRSLIILRYEKTPYHIINGRKPSVKFFYIFGSLCYIVRDGENLDKMKEKDHVSSDLVPQCLTTTLEHESLSLGPQSQENNPHAAETVTASNELDLLFNPMLDELINGTTLVVSKSSAVHAADDLNKRQQHTTTQSSTTTVVVDTPPLNIQTTPETTCQEPTQSPTVTDTENINQAETITKKCTS